MTHRDRVLEAVKALELDVDQVALYNAIAVHQAQSRERGEPSGPDQYLAEVDRTTEEYERVLSLIEPPDFDALMAPDWLPRRLTGNHAEWIRRHTGFTLSSLKNLVSTLSRNLTTDDGAIRFQPAEGDVGRIARLVEVRAAYGIIASRNMGAIQASWHPHDLLASVVRRSENFVQPGRGEVVAAMNEGHRRIGYLAFERTNYARLAGEPTSRRRPFMALHNVYPILNLAHAILHTDVRTLMSIVDERAGLTAAPQATDRDRRTKFVTFFNEKRAERKRVEHQDSTKADEAWATIPLLDHGTLSSRTWGIEIETVTARGISTPAYWDCKDDGSLSPLRESAEDCECSSLDCESGYHGDCDCGCDSGGYGYSEDTAEFVSPILRSFHSRGLEELCTAHVGKGTNNTPGIHVHVGANDLTGAQVVHLSRIYMAIEPLLDPIIRRRERGYCGEVEASRVIDFADRVRMRDLLNVSTGDYEGQSGLSSAYGERYTALNITALSAHGTIEFRAMGPYYNYEHLIRWAWFVRELVNVARLGMPLDRFVAAPDLKAVIDLLVEYGSENVGKVPNWDPAELDSYDLEMSEAEA